MQMPHWLGPTHSLNDSFSSSLNEQDPTRCRYRMYSYQHTLIRAANTRTRDESTSR